MYLHNFILFMIFDHNFLFFPFFFFFVNFSTETLYGSSSKAQMAFLELLLNVFAGVLIFTRLCRVSLPSLLSYNVTFILIV